MGTWTSDEVAAERDAAWCAGYEAGRMARVALEAEARARELVHEQSLATRELARAEASKKGPAWASLILDGIDEPLGVTK